MENEQIEQEIIDKINQYFNTHQKTYRKKEVIEIIAKEIKNQAYLKESWHEKYATERIFEKINPVNIKKNYLIIFLMWLALAILYIYLIGAGIEILINIFFGFRSESMGLFFGQIIIFIISYLLIKKLRKKLNIKPFFKKVKL